jgi:hypothetical protein
MLTNKSPSFQKLLKVFENSELTQTQENSNINDTSTQTKEENLRLAQEYIKTIISKPKTTNITNDSSFKDQGLALGLKVKVIKNITR